jgi:CRP/FNR family transcriptional regulator, cyclic AMP receptor protein
VAKPKLDSMLAAVPLFEGLSKRQLKQVAKLATLVEHPAGATIVKQGGPGESFMAVISGQAKVQVNGKTVGHVLPGDHFGEISLLDGSARTASVVSQTPITLLRIQHENFLRALVEDSPLALALMMGLARMIRRVDRSLAR